MKYKFLNAYEPMLETCPADKYFLSNIQPSVLEQSVREFATTDQGTTFVGKEYDTNFLAHVGWEAINKPNTGYRLFFSQENMNLLSQVIREKLLQAGHNIVVTPRVIGGVMSDIINSHTPIIGDIYTRYTIPQNEPRNDIANLNDRVVNVVVSTIINEEDMRKWNESLTVWDTVLGNFNRKGLNQYTTIRKREKDIMKGLQTTSWNY